MVILRKGNDAVIQWAFYRDKAHTEVYDLTGKDIVCVISRMNAEITLRPSIMGHIARFTFYGTVQETLGPGSYTVTYYENRDKVNQRIIDKVEFCRIINKSEQIMMGDPTFNTPNGEGEITVISLESEISVPMNGMSAYELAVQEGFTGSLDEYLASLHGKDGADGRDGVDGKDGRDGRDGLDGLPGPRGFPGKDGNGLQILDVYPNYDYFILAHPEGERGESYLVNGEIYAWSTDRNRWVNGGRIQGATGNPGRDGYDGRDGATGPVGPKGDKGDKMTYSDYTEDDKDDLRAPLKEVAEQARQAAQESIRQTNISKIAAQEASDNADIATNALEAVKEDIRRAIEQYGSSATDIIASIALAASVELLKSRVVKLESLLAYEVDEDIWESMSEAQQKAIMEKYVTVYVKEGTAFRPEGRHVFEPITGILRLSSNTLFNREDGALVLRDATFDRETGILTLKS